MRKCGKHLLAVVGMVVLLNLSCTECDVLPPRERQCVWQPAKFRSESVACGSLESEGLEFQRNGYCGFVVCVDSDTADECEIEDSPLGDFEERLVHRIYELDHEKNLGFRYAISLNSFAWECAERKPVAGKCCVTAAFSETRPADAGSECI
jgi:hypothetical protein